MTPQSGSEFDNSKDVHYMISEVVEALYLVFKGIDKGSLAEKETKKLIAEVVKSELYLEDIKKFLFETLEKLEEQEQQAEER